MNKKPGGPNLALKKARESLGLSQRKLADELDISDKSQVTKWERGKHTPSLFYQDKLCKLFQKSREGLGFLSPQDPSMPDPRTFQASEERGAEQGVSKPQPLQSRQLYEVLNGTSEALGYPREYESIKEGAPPPLPVKQMSLREGPPPPRRRWSRVIIVVISGLIIALLIFGVVSRTVFPAPPPPPTCGALSDSFHSKLASGWHWENPNERAAYRLTPAGLSLTTPPHSDLDPRFHFQAPRLLRSVTGNFTIETRLVFRPATDFQSAGLLLWQDSSTLIRFERSFEDQKSGLLIQEFDHGATPNRISPLGQFPTTAGVVELRIQRLGDHFTASWREPGPGQSWQTAGETDLHFDRLMVGVDLLDDFNHLQTTTATYSYFHVSCT